MLVLVFGFVLVRVLVHRSVVVRVRMLVRRVVVLVLVVVIAVAVLVRVLDAVRVLVRMLVLVSHGQEIRAALRGRPARYAASAPGLSTTFSHPSVLSTNILYASAADSSGSVCVMTFVGSISPLRMRSMSGCT